MSIGFQLVRFRCLWVAGESIIRLHVTMWKVRRALRGRFGSGWLRTYGTELNHVYLLAADRALLKTACNTENASEFSSEWHHLESVLKSLKSNSFPAYTIETVAGQTMARAKMRCLSQKLGLRGLIFVPTARIEGANNLATQVMRYLEAYLGRSSSRSSVSQASQVYAEHRLAVAGELDIRAVFGEYEFQSLRYFALPMALLAAPT